MNTLQNSDDPESCDLPTLLDECDNGGVQTLTLQVPTNLSFFDGHFENNPVVPGYVLLGWVRYFAQKRYPALFEKGFSAPAIKFTSPVLPEETLSLNLSLTKPDNRLKFGYIRSGDDAPCCSGEIRFTRPYK
jgi:3-hydroxymyristoyl/3-hydroxydecanoyl-(acyl carrier protein) dehydratase